MSFSPDGNRLAVGWFDGHVDLWDVPGRRLVRALTDHEYPYQGRVAFSPVRNLLAATSEPKVVALYDLDSGRESLLWRAPDQDAWDIRDLSFSQDGSRLVIYAGSTPEIGDAVWVVTVSSSQIENRHPTLRSSGGWFHGAARLSPDNQRLYLPRSDYSNYRYSIQCLDLATGQEIWQTESQRDLGLTALAISPDGRVLASGSGYEDSSIRVWEAATGRLVVRLDGHTAWVCKLVFSQDGRSLISGAADQSIRLWDTSTWTQTKVLRGHTDEVHAVAISEPAQLVASADANGDLLLWKADGQSTTEGYSRLPEDLGDDQVLPLDHSRLLLLPPDKPPEMLDLKRDSPLGRCRRSGLLPMSWAGLARIFFATGTEPTRSSSANCVVRSSSNAEPSR